MDWILRDWEWVVRSDAYFLQGLPTDVFHVLIEWLYWDGEEFQKNLNERRDAQEFDAIVEKLVSRYNIKITESINPDDIVTNGMLPIKEWRRAAGEAMARHRPKASGSELILLGD
jgi:hypothetical protein